MQMSQSVAVDSIARSIPDALRQFLSSECMEPQMLLEVPQAT
jgi:hypothetical protein